jgi:hypothetical protein
MMEISTSIFGIARRVIRWAYGFAEKTVCRRAYEISTLYHNHRELIEIKPDPLGDHVSYRLYWDEFLHGERQRAPIIEVRAFGGERLSKVVIAVAASNDKVCYQNEVVMRSVDGRRHRAVLPAVPFRYPKIEGGLVYTPFDSFHVELIEILDMNGKSLKPRRPVSHVTHPMDRLEVALGYECEYVERSGGVYHLGFIEMAINEEMVRLFAWRFYRSALVRKFAEPLQRRWIGKVIFWSKNAIWAAPLQRELERHIAEYKKYLAWRSDEASRASEFEGERT